MKQNKSYSPQEKLRVLKMLETKDINDVAKKYECSVRTIYRWKKQYDGSLVSLENGSSKPLTPHPSAMKKEEIDNALQLMQQRPNLSDKEIAKLLGTNRNPVTIFRLRQKYLPHFTPKKISDITCLFDRESINIINEKEKYNSKYLSPYFIIEISNLEIFVAETKNGNASSFTPFLSKTLKFSCFEDATAFIKNSKNTMPWELKVKKINEF